MENISLTTGNSTTAIYYNFSTIKFSRMIIRIIMSLQNTMCWWNRKWEFNNKNKSRLLSEYILHRVSLVSGFILLQLNVQCKISELFYVYYKEVTCRLSASLRSMVAAPSLFTVSRHCADSDSFAPLHWETSN